jgi:acrylyl-CoA reductase (NADPH)
VDTVGGDTLSAAVSQLRYKGAVAACGVAGGPKVDASVFPFILRGVRLLGVDSVMAPMGERLRVWARLQVRLPQD